MKDATNVNIEKKITMSDLKDRSVIEQSKVLFEYGEKGRGLISMLRDFWPVGSPQRCLFDELNYNVCIDGTYKIDDHRIIAKNALRESAESMVNKCENIIKKLGVEEKEKTYMLYLFGSGGTVEKGKIKQINDKISLYKSMLGLAADYYAQIAANSRPKELTRQKISFKGGRNVDEEVNTHHPKEKSDIEYQKDEKDDAGVDSLARSIAAHYVIYNTGKCFNDSVLLDLSKTVGETTISYIGDLYNLSIADINKNKNKLELSVPEICYDGISCDGITIKYVTLGEILNQYVDVG